MDSELVSESHGLLQPKPLIHGAGRRRKPRVHWCSLSLSTGVRLLPSSVYISLKGSFTQRASI